MPQYSTTVAATPTVRSLVLRLMHVPSLAGQFAVAGGLVPWLISGQMAPRMHGDLDLVAPASAMPAFRQWLQHIGKYDARLDSLVQLQRAHDYGLYAIIDGVCVNIAPYVVTPTGILQYNCTLATLNEATAGMEVTLPHMTASDYVVTRPWLAETTLAHFPLALVKATKLVTQRPKDAIDIAEIDRIRVDEAHVARYQRYLAQLSLTVVTPTNRATT